MRREAKRFGAIVASGLVLLVWQGEARAQEHFLRGDDGVDRAESVVECIEDECTLSRSLTIEGHLAVSGDLEVGSSVSIGTIEVDELDFERSIWFPECPSGYARDRGRRDIVLCARDLGDGVVDEMVKVGAIWVDRYEASVWSDAACSETQYGGDADNWDEVAESFPRNGSFTAPLYACSIHGVMPTRWVTWFQAQSACVAAGKRLLTNSEWQAAVGATYDPSASSVDPGPCLTASGEPRATGRAGDSPRGLTSCISHWGAEDMVGNLAEWTSDWWGQGLDSADGTQPLEFGGDGFSNVDDAEEQGGAGRHFPAAALRGGDHLLGEQSGPLAIVLTPAPSAYASTTGFRCARGM